MRRAHACSTATQRWSLPSSSRQWRALPVYDAADALLYGQAGEPKVVHMLAASYIAHAGQQMLRETRVPYFDLAGNAWFAHDRFPYRPPWLCQPHDQPVRPSSPRPPRRPGRRTLPAHRHPEDADQTHTPQRRPHTWLAVAHQDTSATRPKPEPRGHLCQRQAATGRTSSAWWPMRWNSLRATPSSSAARMSPMISSAQARRTICSRRADRSSGI
jgi:hypothetical protein